MVQQVDVDGEIHEFPDEATPAMMQAALTRSTPNHSLSDVMQFLFTPKPAKKVAQDIGNVVKNTADAATQGFSATLNQLMNNPRQAGKNLIAGAMSIPFNTGNAILNIPQYLASLESDKVSDFLKKHTPEIPTEGIVNASFGAPISASDEAVRGFGSLLPVGIPVTEAVGKAAISGTKAAGSKVLGKTDAALEANEALLGSNLEDKAAEVGQKTAAAQIAKDANEEAIAKAQQEIGKSNPDLMQYNVSKRQEAIKNMTEEASNLQKELAGVKPEETELPKAQENLARSQENLQNAQQMGNDVDTNIGQHLNEGAQHDVRFSQGLTHRIDAIENYANDTYKTLMQNISDAKFQMPQTAMNKLDYDKMSPTQLIKTFGPEAFEALKKNKMDQFISKQKAADLKQTQASNPYLANLMEVAPSAADTNAADFLAKYKDFRDRTFKLSRRWSDPRVEELEKQKMGEALKQARTMQSQMKKVLDEGLGEYKPEFERANKLYSEQVYPLRANPIVEKASEGTNSSNIIHDLRTNQEGMPLVRELVKQDPELLRNAVGQRYFSKPQDVLNPNETMREYLSEMPELQQLLEQKQAAGEGLQQAKSNAELAEKHHAEISSRHVESTKTQKKINDIEADIKNHQNEIDKMKIHIDELNKTRKNKNLTLKEKMQAEKEFKDLNRQLKQTSQKLDDKITGLRKLYRVAKTAYRIGRARIP